MIGLPDADAGLQSGLSHFVGPNRGQGVQLLAGGRHQGQTQAAGQGHLWQGAVARHHHRPAVESVVPGDAASLQRRRQPLAIHSTQQRGGLKVMIAVEPDIADGQPFWWGFQQRQDTLDMVGIDMGHHHQVQVEAASAVDFLLNALAQERRGTFRAAVDQHVMRPIFRAVGQPQAIAVFGR